MACDICCRQSILRCVDLWPNYVGVWWRKRGKGIMVTKWYRLKHGFFLPAVSSALFHSKWQFCLFGS